MRPVDDMKPSEDEIIAHIKDSLYSYEEAYVPGAWQHFNKREEHKPGILLWIGRLSSAAALLIVGSLLFWYADKTPDSEPVKTVASESRDAITATPGNSANVVEDIAIAENKLVSGEKKGVTYAYTAVITEKPVNVALADETVEVAHIPVKSEVESLIAQAVLPVEENRVEGVDSRSSFEEFLKSESKNTANVTGKENVEKGNKWALGVVVSPSIGSTNKLNMGYGLSMGYALSDKVSLNSGISYNELAASRNIDQVAAPASTAIAGESKSLESIEQRVTGIDIPLDIRYNLGKNVYANVGVSAFAVIDQNRNNTYLQEKVVDRSSFASPTSTEFKNQILSEKVTEDAPESEIDHNKYIGFYNFSFGYKQKVAKDESISIEPFMKVPMKEITKDNLRLMGTGIKLRFDF